MWPESADGNKGTSAPVLKTGLTTGCCATTCSVAAAKSLFDTRYVADTVTVTLPQRNKQVHQSIFKIEKGHQSATAYTVKDAGDDPDVTHGAMIWATIELISEETIHFVAGKGVGTVTREGLSLAVGEPAINPVPRKMISEHLQQIAEEFGYDGGFKVTVGVENGEALALKTMNPKLGILGGLSILGTTGIVRPFSCSAYIASIRQGIDVAVTNGESHLAASTGNLSEQAVQKRYSLSDMAMIEMGDFIGALVKHINSRFKQGLNIPDQLTVSAGFGKLTKLADGHMDLHSRASSINFHRLKEWVQQLNGSEQLLAKVEQANTSIEVLNECNKDSLDLARFVCEKARCILMARLPNTVEVEVLAINRKGEIIGEAN